MSCSSFEPSIVDLARGVELEDRLRARLVDHLSGCAACASRLAAEHEMTRALRGVAAIAMPPADLEAETALLSAFDAHHAIGPRPRTSMRWLAYAAATMLAVGGVIAARDARRQPRIVTRLASRVVPAVGALPAVASTPLPESGARPAGVRSSSAASDAAFIVWPGAAPLPAFESGELMRVELPASVAVSLGLAPRARAPRVQADVLVGQDGYVRAVRLAP